MRRAEEHFTLLHYLYIRLYDARGAKSVKAFDFILHKRNCRMLLYRAGRTSEVPEFPSDEKNTATLIRRAAVFFAIRN
ncbi:hypothetical protein C3766_14745 [Heyndrickxia coagulans]|nr:hypothetical protein C3766_14745 [Heyndrickxia coagulans]